MPESLAQGCCDAREPKLKRLRRIIPMSHQVLIGDGRVVLSRETCELYLGGATTAA